VHPSTGLPSGGPSCHNTPPVLIALPGEKMHQSRSCNVPVRRSFDYAVYLALRVLIMIVQALPLDLCQRWSQILAVLFSDLFRLRGQVVDDNLRHAYPELTSAQRRDLARRMWAHLFLMVAEVVQARRKIHRTNWHRHVRFLNSDQTARLLLDDRPTIMISGHFGNFEMSGYFLGLFGFPTYTIARPLDNPYLDRFLQRFRGATGQYMLPKQGSAKQVERLLEQGAALALLGDQHAGASGCWVDFFGRPASTHKAIALFCLASGAPLVVSYSQRLDQPLCYESGLEGVADPNDPKFAQMTLPELTQWHTGRLEAIINRAPQQYWWLHRRWKGAPGRRRKRRAKRQQAA
jgi:KDO2-lipid IV(A) lauroyltransferase